MVTINNIPVYNALITDEDTGMYRISLVDDPAVMSNFLAFSNERMPMMYAVQDEEKRLIRGVIMRADFPIFRISPRIGEYYIIYKAEQIRRMAEKYLLDGLQNAVNTMHEEDSDVTGVNMVQYFIKGDGISVEGFEDIADGSLLAEFHVTNDAVWEAIKAGTYKGFSLEGFFELAPETEAEKTAEIVDALQGNFKKQSHTNSIMSKLSRFRAALAKVFAEFANITTDKGVLAWDGEGDIQVGDEVYLVDAEGNNTTAADGEYTTEEGRVIEVVDGEVANIREAEVTPVETPAETPAEDAGEVTAEGEGETETPAEETTEEDKDAKIAELEAKVAELEAENANLKEEIAKLTGEAEELRKMSAAKPAHVEAEGSMQFAKTGVKGLDNLARKLSSR